MSAPVADHVGGVDSRSTVYEGTLFGGIKFWVHQRVPSRSDLLNSLKANGGKVVQLEKLADVKVDDHARKNVAPGFTSWKYISDSIEKKKLQNIENYTIGRVATARPVGSTQPVKSTRNKFTHEEDQVLRKYVLQKVREGEKISGNEIYKSFAEQFPSHTWHSWRDRWLRHLSKVEAPEPDGEADQEDPPPSRQLTPKSVIPSKRSPVHAQPARSAGTSGTPPPAPAPAPAPPKGLEDRKAGLRSAAISREPEERLNKVEAAEERPKLTKEKFYTRLRDLQEFNGHQPVPWVRIGTKTVGLWDLWSAVRKSSVRDWEAIAEELGLQWLDSGITGGLEAKFKEHLGQFERLIDSLSEEEEEGEQEEDVEEEGSQEGSPEDDAAEELGAGDASFEQPASPPPISGQKRSFGHVMSASTDGLLSPRKRQRYGGAEEIPCTPEKPQRTHDNGVRGSQSHASFAIRSTPLAPQQLQPASRRVAEPETQDFQFSVEIKEEQYTPSQQLLLESSSLNPASSPPPAQPVVPPPITPSRNPRPVRVSPGSSTSSGDEGFPSVDRILKRSPPKPAPPKSGQSGHSTSTKSSEGFGPPLGTQVACQISVGSGSPTVPATKRRSLPWKQDATPPSPRGSSRERSIRNWLTDSHGSSETAPARRFTSRRSPTAANKPPPSTLADERSKEDVVAAVERYESLGYPLLVVTRAFKATSLDLGLAGHVMESLKAGRGLPDEPGVWTAEDDAGLKLVSELDVPENRATASWEDLSAAVEARQRLLAKHGQARLGARQKYLEEEGRL